MGKMKDIVTAREERRRLAGAPLIITDYWPKPIPVRQFDWCAHTDNYEPGEPLGLGSTEAEAIKDLQEQLDEGRD